MLPQRGVRLTGDRVAVTVLLPPRLARAMLDAAQIAGRLREDGSITLDHLILMAPERAFEEPSKTVSKPSDTWAGTGPRRFCGGAESRPGRELRSPVPAPTQETETCD